MRKTILIAIFATLGAAEPPNLKSHKKFYADDPIWSEPRPVPAKAVSVRKLNEYYDFFENTFFPPGERARRSGEWLPSQGINTVDEAPDSAWYTNRHASRRMTIEELQRGPGNSRAPAPGVWTVIAAKNEGITPGFRVRDAAGRKYLIKFDPVTNPEMASGADVITSKFFYALGYNVPENYVVHFDRSQIAIGEGATLKDDSGRKRPIRERNIDDMLAKSPRMRDGRHRALAKLLISGKPVGPFKYDGTRSDDPNDLIPHEHRRDLRALRTFCAWLGHDDSKALNTLDVMIEENGIPYLKHYLIDFGASLGSASFQANSPRDGSMYLFDWKSSAAQFFSLGLYVPAWQRAKYPNLPSVGRFEYETFDAQRWVGDYPSTAFRNENPADRLWAARKIMAFTDDEIRALVATGQYSDAAASEWMARCLIERRNKIVNAFASGMGALDDFEVREGRLAFRGALPDAVSIQWSVFDNRSGLRQRLAGERNLEVPRVRDGIDYLVAELSASSGPSVAVYVRLKNNPGVVGIERRFNAMPNADPRTATVRGGE